jgi:endo-1,4-beta-xylanase
MSELEKSIVAFAKLGCKVSITELDMSVLPVYNPKVDMKTALNPAYWESLNPYRHALPQKIADIQHRRYREMFEILLKHSDKIDRVTFWGISDKHSFKNIFPVPGRTDYPLLFDRKYRAKPIVKELIEMGKNHYY